MLEKLVKRFVAYGGAALILILCFGEFRSLWPPGLLDRRRERERELRVDEGPASSRRAAVLSASDWPHLRGPHHNSTSDETDLAESWPPEGPPLLWVRRIGEGYSGCAVVGDRLYSLRLLPAL
jgi:hypothetical protein